MAVTPCSAAPFPAERMQAHAIGPAIGNVRNEDARLIEPVSLG